MCAAGRATTKELPFRNAGNIPLRVRLKVSSDHPELFSISPDFLLIQPRQVKLNKRCTLRWEAYSRAECILRKNFHILTVLSPRKFFIIQEKTFIHRIFSLASYIHVLCLGRWLILSWMSYSMALHQSRSPR